MCQPKKACDFSSAKEWGGIILIPSIHTCCPRKCQNWSPLKSWYLGFFVANKLEHGGWTSEASTFRGTEKHTPYRDDMDKAHFPTDEKRLKMSAQSFFSTKLYEKIFYLDEWNGMLAQSLSLTLLSKLSWFCICKGDCSLFFEVHVDKQSMQEMCWLPLMPNETANSLQ